MKDGVIKTAGRVFEVLEFFREVRRPLSVREVSKHFAYPLSSTAVLLKSIASLGYLNYDRESHAYFPTTRLGVLGDWIFESLFGNGELLSLVAALAQRTRETVILAQQNDVYVQYVHIIPSQHPVQFYTPVGTRRLLCMSGLGWAILSEHSDEVIYRQIMRSTMRLGKTARSITEDTVFEHVHAVRKLGYGFSRNTVTRGASVIAMPLPPASDGARFGIAVAGVTERIESNLDTIVRTMRLCINDYLATPAHAGPDATSARPSSRAPAV
jgi:DNA-binding IclR family transcriptional regulator